MARRNDEHAIVLETIAFIVITIVAIWLLQPEDTQQNTQFILTPDAKILPIRIDHER